MNLALFIAWFLASMSRPLTPLAAAPSAVSSEPDVLSFLLGEVDDCGASWDGLANEPAMADVLVADDGVTLVPLLVGQLVVSVLHTRLVSIQRMRPPGVRCIRI